MQKNFLPPTDWDKRYRDNFYDNTTKPHELLVRFSTVIPKGRVLDVAMGSGRDGLYLAGKDYSVWGIDRSSEAIKIAREKAERAGQPLSVVRGDGSNLPFRAGSFEGVLVFYFLLRDNISELITLLKPGGVLIYETYLERQNNFDRRRNPAYLLKDGELISSLREVTPLFYEEGVALTRGKKRATAKFVGRKS